MEREHLQLAREFRRKHPTVCRQLDWTAKGLEDGHRELAFHMRNDPPDGWPESAINGAVCYCMAVSYGLVRPLVSAQALAAAAAAGAGAEDGDGE